MANDNLRVFAPGEVVFKEGEKGDLMYVLIEGAVELRKRVERGTTVLKIVDTPNDFFGEMALLDERPRSATAIASRETKVLVVDGPTFESMILANGKFALKIIKVLAARIRRSNDQVSEIIDTMPRERIARGMVDFALRHGEKLGDGSMRVDVAAMKQWINTHVGAGHEEIEAALFHLLKDEDILQLKGLRSREELILPADFVRENDRRRDL
jgi:CRP/FNR family transcriptional regulator, cyclic AMP receptor protein